MGSSFSCLEATPAHSPLYPASQSSTLCRGSVSLHGVQRAARRARRRIFWSREAEQMEHGAPSCRARRPSPAPGGPGSPVGRAPPSRPALAALRRPAPLRARRARAWSGAEGRGRSRSSRRVRELRPLPRRGGKRRERGGPAAGTEGERGGRGALPASPAGRAAESAAHPSLPGAERDGTRLGQRPPGRPQNLPCWRRPEREGRARGCGSRLPSSPAERGKENCPGPLLALPGGAPRFSPAGGAGRAGLAGAVTEGRAARPGPAPVSAAVPGSGGAVVPP